MRILSGIQPTGILHIGNYFGMMRPAIALQAEGGLFTSSPITMRLPRCRIGSDAGKCPAGGDRFLRLRTGPRPSGDFSPVRCPPVTELSWILSTVTPMGLLERCHSYKDQDGSRFASVRWPFYLSSLNGDQAGILIYDSDAVPVGKDQKQHLEVASRDIAVKVNETYGKRDPSGQIFRLPEARTQAATETVPGTDGQKMSKSYGNTIDIFGDEKETRKRVMGIITDSTPVESRKILINRPFSTFTRSSRARKKRPRWLMRFDAAALVTAISRNSFSPNCGNTSSPCENRHQDICNDPSYVETVLEKGARSRNEIADRILARVPVTLSVCKRKWQHSVFTLSQTRKQTPYPEHTATRSK